MVLEKAYLLSFVDVLEVGGVCFVFKLGILCTVSTDSPWILI